MVGTNLGGSTTINDIVSSQGSTLVKYFTKFTKDIFNALVALLFIYEAINKLGKIFKKHPLQSKGPYSYDVRS